MADSRELTFGMDFGLDDALGKLNDAIDRLESLADSAGEAEDAAQDMGAHVSAGTDAPAIAGISFSSICICTKPLACSVALISTPLGRDSACSA